jgi:hypothetical protein
MQRAHATPLAWAKQVFGPVAVGDLRRTDRIVQVAAAWAASPDGSLPQQAADPAALKAVYRLLHNEALTVDELLAPHQALTRQAANHGPVVLLVQDTTTLDFSAHRAADGLSPIGDGRGRGFYLQTVLAVAPEDRVPLGVLAAELWGRQPTPEGSETRTERAKRPRESAIWGRLVTQVGSPPDGVRWVHVADRGADCYDFFTAVASTGSDVLVRVVQNRCLTEPTGAHLLDTLRAQPARAERSLTVTGRPDRPGRTAQVAVSWLATTLRPPALRDRAQPVPSPVSIWAVRVWEPDPPLDTVPVEWLLATTVPVTTVAQAWERVDWYTARWLIEEFHMGLKTGCGAERTQLRDRAALERRVALLLPLAVRLLLLRTLARRDPNAPVDQLAQPIAVALVAARTRQPPATTVGGYLRQVARLGGHQGRTGDGPPGWRTLWRGWFRVEEMLTGVHLSRQLGIT